MAAAMVAVATVVAASAIVAAATVVAAMAVYCYNIVPLVGTGIWNSGFWGLVLTLSSLWQGRKKIGTVVPLVLRKV